jgi:hypothetical protein
MLFHPFLVVAAVFVPAWSGNLGEAQLLSCAFSSINNKFEIVFVLSTDSARFLQLSTLDSQSHRIHPSVSIARHLVSLDDDDDD